MLTPEKHVAVAPDADSEEPHLGSSFQIDAQPQTSCVASNVVLMGPA